MTQPIGIRLPNDVLKKIEKISKKEMVDRSTIIRKLVLLGYTDLIRKTAAEDYCEGTLTLSEAAHQAGITLWDMERYLVEHGFISSYSLEDLDHELQLLK